MITTKIKFKKGDIVSITEERLLYEVNKWFEDIVGKHAKNRYIVLGKAKGTNYINVYRISNLDNIQTYEYHSNFLELHKSHIRKEKIDKILKDDN